jgi:hypothetical protein
MRGSPLRSAFLTALAIGLMALPLWKLTDRPAPPPPMEKKKTTAAADSIELYITFSHSPKFFEVFHLGKSVWKETYPGSIHGKTIPLEFPKEGIDLQIKAVWPADTSPTAVRLQVHHGTGGSEETVWTENDTMDEVLTFR